MSTGTIKLTSASAAVAGTGTAFKTDLIAGDFVVATVGGITYTLPVKSVESDTALTLVASYTGPTQEGQAWYAVPRATQNQITSALVAQTTEALRGLNYDKKNWQQILTGSGNVTVKLPDGTEITGLAWPAIISAMKNYLPLAGGVLTNDGAVITLKAKTAGSGVYLIMDDSDGSNLCYLGKGSKDNNDAVFNNYKGGNNSIILRANGSVELTAQQSQPINLNAEPRTTSANAWRIVYGDYGAFWRQDGGSLYLMLTNKGDPRGSYNALRPFHVDLSTGTVGIGTPLCVSNTIAASKEITVGVAKKFSVNPQNSATLDAHLNHWGNADRPTVLEFGDTTSYHFYSQRNKDGSITLKCAGTIDPSTWANFDARYYTQTAANAKFQPKSNSGSDERHKSDIEVVQNPLASVLSWRGVTYERKDADRGVGLIAQDVEKCCPEAVTDGGERTFSDGTVIEDFRYLDVSGVSAAYHTEAIRELFNLVEQAITDPDKAKSAIAALRGKSASIGAKTLDLKAVYKGESSS